MLMDVMESGQFQKIIDKAREEEFEDGTD